MKKSIVLLVVLSMVLTLLAGCAQSTTPTAEVVATEVATEVATAAATEAVVATTEAAPAGSGMIGVAFPTLAVEFYSAQEASLKKNFEADGYEVNVVSFEGDPNTHVTVIENFIQQGVEMIYTFVGQDEDAIHDSVVKAREAGITVIGLGVGRDSASYDYIIATDFVAAGAAVAEMASAWIDQTFPDAADGSIEVAIISGTNSFTDAARTQGLQTIAELNPKVTVVELFDFGAEPNIGVKAAEYADIIKSKYPNLKAVLTFGEPVSLAVNESYMTKADLNKEEFGIFGLDATKTICDLLLQSENGESLIRGGVSFGFDMALTVYQAYTGQLQKDANNNIFTEIVKVDATNAQEINDTWHQE